MKKSITLIVFVSFLWAYSGVVFGQSISITQINPSSPADLAHNEEVTIHFDYSINEPGGARIFIRPMTSGSRSPNYAASGSQVYRGTGSSTANFSITSGNVHVDQIRVQVTGVSPQEVLSEFLMPVDFSFSAPVAKFPIPPDDPFPVTEIPDTLINSPTATRIDSIPEDARVKRRTMTSDGTIEIHYTGGYVRGFPPSGGEYIVSPAGDTTWSKLLPMVGVQEADQPVTPLGIAESSARESQKELLRELNKWMEWHSNRLMSSINALVTDEKALQNYKNYEEKTCNTIYDRIDLRYTVLEKLMQGETFQ